MIKNMEKEKEFSRIRKEIDNCSCVKVLHNIGKCIQNFVDQYSDVLANEKLSTYYREKYRDLDC